MALIPQYRRVWTHCYIGRTDGVTWECVDDCLTSVKINCGDVSGIGADSSGTDSVARTATFTFCNDRAMMINAPDTASKGDTEVLGDELAILGADKDSADNWFSLLTSQITYSKGISISPKDRLSARNQINGNYSPLIWSGREIILKTCEVPIGQEPTEADYKTRYHGVMSHVNDNGSVVTCECRDMSKKLQDVFIEIVREYGSSNGVAIETVIQQIMTDNLGVQAPSLYVPITPETAGVGFRVRKYKPEYSSVWDAIQNLATQIGWYLGFRYDPNTDTFRLTLMEPPRDKTYADYALSWTDDFYEHSVDISDEFVRNAVTVFYKNSSTGKREFYSCQDDDSITQWGRRAMTIEEDDASEIDTQPEAKTMGDSALHDLSGLNGTVNLSMPLFWGLDLFSTFSVDNPRVSSTVDIAAVQSVQHTLSWGEDGCEFRTQILGSGKVTGGFARWHKMDSRPGAGGEPPKNRQTNTTPDAPTNIRATPSMGAIKIEWSAVPDKDVSVYEVWRRDGAQTDVAGASKIGTLLGTSFSDTTGVSGSTYTYWVRAINIGQKASDFSGPATAEKQKVSGTDIGDGQINHSHFGEIRNVMVYNQVDSLEIDQDIQFPFHIPSETNDIVKIYLSAQGIPFRAYSKTGQAAGKHAHDVDLTHVHTGTANLAGAHSHSVSGNIAYTAGDHTHTLLVPTLQKTQTSVSVDNHQHPLVYGIYESTTPNGIRIWGNNGGEWILLKNYTYAPDSTTPFPICTELDITTLLPWIIGWNQIRFTTTRLGRIAWQLIVKVDLKA